MSERLTEAELADVFARIADPRCHVCDGRSFVPVSSNASVSCSACEGTGALALSTQTMASIVGELTARRAMDLTAEERPDVEWLLKRIATNTPARGVHVEQTKRALAVLARLVKEQP